ncbi:MULTISPECIES: LysR family transcriptional regulator [Aurantimonas]|uniref:LysR family transcriptional regulator n=1 Tax=Aurantimonas TaxID=182269 RepID=UPI003518EED6
MLNAQWLETFTTLCETGHFTRAASRLAMTQPGVSQHLRKLEEQLGERLVTRDGKSFSLTPAGEAVLAVGRARRVEEQALRTAILRDDADERWRSPVRAASPCGSSRRSCRAWQRRRS